MYDTEQKNGANVSHWQVIDLSTGSRRDDVTASVGELTVSKSGRFVVVDDYERQRALAVHCLDGLLQQLAQDDAASGLTPRCSGFMEPDPALNGISETFHNDICGNRSTQSQPGVTIEEFNLRCKLPPPPPVCTRTG